VPLSVRAAVMEPRRGPLDGLELNRISARKEREYSAHGHVLPEAIPAAAGRPRCGHGATRRTASDLPV